MLARRGMVGLQPADAPGGARVAALHPGGPAALAGLSVGDVVTHVDGRPTPDAASLRAALAPLRAGDVVTVRAAQRDVALTAAPRPVEAYEGLRVHYGEARAGSFALRTIAVTPPGDGPFPAVVMLQGYAPASVERHAQAPASDALRGLVASLARRGLCVWRCERRGVGDSEGPAPREARFEDDTADHAASVAAARASPLVRDVTLFGHSLGALHAPLVAAEADAVVLYGAGSLTWLEYLDAQARRHAALAGLGAVEAERLVRAQQGLHHRVILGAESVRDVLAREPALAASARALGVDADGCLHGRADDYWRAVQACEVAAPVGRMRAPVVAMWGASDWLSSREEHVALAAMAADGRFEEVPEADHGFFRHATAEASFRARWTGEAHEGLAARVAAVALGASQRAR